MTDMNIANETHYRFIFTLLLLTALFLSFFQLGSSAFIDYDEATYAQVLHESLQRKDLLSFTKDGEPWFDKPPLLFWMMAASVGIFGETELALRLPSAFFIVLAIILTWLMGLRLFRDPTVALGAAFILLTTTIFIFSGRQVRMDIPVTTAILFTFYAFIRGVHQPAWYIGVGMGIAVGVLLKSVIGLLAIPLFFIHSLIYQRWDWLLSRYFWFGILLMTAILLPWLIQQHILYGESFWNHLISNIVGRYANPVIGTQIPFYYTKHLIKFVEPWTAVFVIVLIAFLLTGWRNFFRRKAQLTTLSIALFMLFLFGSSASKLFFYIAPLFPFMALFIVSTGIPLIRKAKLRWPYMTVITVSALVITAFTATVIQIFFPTEHGTMLLPMGSSLTRSAEEEKIIGELIKSEAIPVYIFSWPSHETINYYRNPQKPIIVTEKTMLKKPCFLVVSQYALENKFFQLNDPSSRNTQTLFEGLFLTLYRVETI
ncbi:MAG: hypothetical protein A3H62_02620 [Candidatus Ryanbacteria bacterium RIFCSPLOWO2_02_FULL_44_40]|nr:MAG: hypothetical protein A2W41_03315 [Candidatus Ryanbacteria bacterium RIFCSPHIGHO2_01_45_13]OGZ52013.1 MAG: hypothetical protein A3A17_00965 [Candidatus Ryanbacteria bacterium RIFCSPLOWO2_01_FULL_44_230]OGZ54086.1 MAG: hypothetical protein A3H62_02620 [Candidatus Ryanbacteria bacterium RIFCSPLOWO2_02_FULL_44_40]OGZ54917.1 MAG: hypothetical protein A3F85_01990 [Candidatus Ryanbacteria bacterium RIFCSPLOWO2_12_FULL_44_26]